MKLFSFGKKIEGEAPQKALFCIYYRRTNYNALYMRFIIRFPFIKMRKYPGRYTFDIDPVLVYPSLHIIFRGFGRLNSEQLVWPTLNIATDWENVKED